MRPSRGVVVLSTVLAFSTVIIGMVLAGVFVVQLINRSNFGIRLAAETEAVVGAAIEDVKLRLIRGDFKLSVWCNDNAPVFTKYDNLILGRTNAVINVCKYENSCGFDVCRYRARIEGWGMIFVRRRLEVVFDVDAATGQVKISSVEKLEF